MKIFRQWPNLCMPAAVQSALYRLGRIKIPQMVIARQLAWPEIRNQSDIEIKQWYYDSGPNPEDLVDAQFRINPRLNVRYIYPSSLEELRAASQKGEIAILNYSFVRERLVGERGEGRYTGEEHYAIYLGDDRRNVSLGDTSKWRKPRIEIVPIPDFLSHWRETNSPIYFDERKGRAPKQREAMFLSLERN